ncbi:MAG: chalcone isomerase family protein [Burkholderiales bacterium]|nr:chalcone isomerase family protein [Burkholderiales bacterium]
MIALDKLQSTAYAQASIPQEIGDALPGAQFAGSSRFRYFGLSVYDARLWVSPGFQVATYAQHGLALELTYLRSLSGKAIAERSLKEMRRAEALAADTEKNWLTAMQDAFPDVGEGDRITGLHTPASGAKFWFNGQARATIRDTDFSRLFFGIWLSETTSEPRLRSELLGRVAS